MKKEKEMLTAEDYRRRADDHKKIISGFWKNFGKTGIFMAAAACVVLGLCLAWFASSSGVQGEGMKVQAAADGDFELASEGTESDVGWWDQRMTDVAVGTQAAISDRQLMMTGSDRNAIRWAITDSSNMGNKQVTGIRPGSAGKLTFYIVAKKSGPLTVTLDVSMTGVARSSKKELPQEAKDLLSGHVLLFAGYDEQKKAYSGWISEDASSWQMTLTGESQISDQGGNGGTAVLKWHGNGKLTWEANVSENTAYPVDLYWIWPEVVGEYIFKDSTYMEDCPVLFSEDASQEKPNNPAAQPGDLFQTMCNAPKSSRSNRYFKWAYGYSSATEVKEKTDEFRITVTTDKLSDLRNSNDNYDGAVYGSICDYYNRADQYLGEKVQYLSLCVVAQ